MPIGSIFPLILIFLLSVFGISGNFFLLLFIVLMLLCHLMMPRHSEKHNHHGGNDSKTGGWITAFINYSDGLSANNAVKELMLSLNLPYGVMF